MQLNGKSVSRETAQKLEHFATLFQKWAKTINLVAPSTLNELWSRHIADSAQIYQASPGPYHWVDLGSGGGFPGVITAILLTEHKDGWVDLVESNQKKAAFLRVALSETGARGAVHPIRIEAAPEKIPSCDRISRAHSRISTCCSTILRPGWWVRKHEPSSTKAGIIFRKSRKPVAAGDLIW